MKLRYFDWDGQVHVAKGKTGGQQGDPLEMFIFNLTVHHIWGRVLAKFQGARAVAYADDGYMKGKLSVVLQVLTELKSVLKEDSGLELNISKTAVLSKDITQQTLFDVTHVFINNSTELIHPSGELSLDSFRPNGFVGMGVPIGTDNFVRQFVAKKCTGIIEDVEKLDAIEDSFIHFQLLRFCQATRMQHINSHRLVRTGRTWSSICLTPRGVLVCLLIALLKMMLFTLLRHVLCRGWALSLRNVRSCGCLRMISGTRPLGHPTSAPSRYPL